MSKKRLKAFLTDTLCKIFTDQSEVNALPAGCFFQFQFFNVNKEVHKNPRLSSINI